MKKTTAKKSATPAPPRVLNLKSPASPARRSPCPVACTLDLLGDRWTLLVIRDLFMGRSRFKEFANSPEGIPTNILSNRLAMLLEKGVVVHCPASDGTKRLAYQLTEKGRSLGPILGSMRDWGLNWEPGTAAMMSPLQKKT
jgi:DNA-binding HxlR family transcriptional regulator